MNGLFFIIIKSTQRTEIMLKQWFKQTMKLNDFQRTKYIVIKERQWGPH